MTKKNLKLIILSFCLFCSGCFAPTERARADAGLTLGIIGTVLGGTALASQVLNGCGMFGCPGVAPATLPPVSYTQSEEFLQVFAHNSYNAPCPSYPGWYSPYGHIGYPCFTCHTEY